MSRRSALLVDSARLAARTGTFEGRSEPRVDVRVEASLREGGTSFRFTVDILDLSVSGFRFETSCDICVGLRVVMTQHQLTGSDGTRTSATFSFASDGAWEWVDA